MNFHRDHPGITLILSGASHNAALDRGDAELVHLPTDHATPSRDISLVTYPDLKRSAAIRAAMAFLAEVVVAGCPIKRVC